jgi:hypothetical protein
MSKKFLRRVGEKGIVNAVERCMNFLEEWKKDKKLKSRLRFEQSVRLLVKSIPEDWQDSQFVDDLYRACLGLLDRRGMVFVKEG